MHGMAWNGMEWTAESIVFEVQTKITNHSRISKKREKTKREGRFPTSILENILLKQ